VERALEYLRVARFREALGDLLLAEEARPDDPYLQRDLGKAYRGVGDPNSAASHFEKALALKADLLEARVLLGLALMEAQRIAEARPHLEQARREAPDDPRVATNVALALLQAGQIESALREFERAASLGDLSGPAHNAWGSVLAQQGRLGKALEHFETAFLSNPKNPQVVFNLGLTAEAMGHREKAMDYYRQTMAIEPNPMAEERLAQLAGGS
jgi:Tfp pilus assembly protein PilF